MSVPAHCYRLAVCLSHPIQYRVPLLRRLAAHPRISRLKAFFYTDIGLVSRPDAYHGMTAKWDVPLLEGYESEILPDWRPIRRQRGGYFNPSIVSRLVKGDWDAVLISSYEFPSDWMAWMAAKWKRMGVLFHGEMYPGASSSTIGRLKALPKKIMLGGRTACLAIGSVAANVYRDLGVPDGRIFPAPYAVDNGFFLAQSDHWQGRKSELKAEYGIRESTPVVLCVAGMVPKKRQVDLIQALARLEMDVRLVLVGTGSMMDEVRAACRQYVPETMIMGFKNQTELPHLYAMADVFVLPSLWEEFGLVVNEAMCFGLPVIASETVASSRDLVRHGENGFTFPPRDIDALASHLRTLLEDAGLRREFGRRSREIIANWSYDQTIDGILSALEFACGNANVESSGGIIR